MFNAFGISIYFNIYLHIFIDYVIIFLVKIST